MGLDKSQKLRIEIIAYFKIGKPLKEISEMTSKSYSTVKRIISRWKITGSSDRKRNSGRPKILNQADISLIN